MSCCRLITFHAPHSQKASCERHKERCEADENDRGDCDPRLEGRVGEDPQLLHDSNGKTCIGIPIRAFTTLNLRIQKAHMTNRRRILNMPMTFKIN
jgi:hypothetical protein